MKNFSLIFRLQEFIGRMTRIENRYRIETDNFIQTSNITQNVQTEGYKEQNIPMSKQQNQP